MSKKDLKHSNEVIEKMNKEIKKLEDRILDGKTTKEQEKIKNQWEKNKIKTENKLKKEFEKFDIGRKELEKRQKELIPLEVLNDRLNEMMEELNKKWDETLKTIEKEVKE